MIKYDVKGSRQQRLPYASKSAQKKTHLERKAKTQNNSYVVDLSSKSKGVKHNRAHDKTQDQSEAKGSHHERGSPSQTAIIEEVFEDSLQKTPVPAGAESKIETSDSL